MNKLSTHNIGVLFGLLSIIALAAFSIPSPDNPSVDDAENNRLDYTNFVGGGSGEIFGFYTPIFSSGPLAIDVLCFPKMNGGTTTLGTPLSSINYTPSSVMLPTNTSSYDPITTDLVCLVSREQQLFTYNDLSCSSGIVNLTPAFATAPVFLNGQLWGIDIKNNGFPPPGPKVNIEIVNNIQTGFINGFAPFQFMPNAPYLFNHEQMSSATNGTDELYFVSGSNLIIVQTIGIINPAICWVDLDLSGQYSFYGIEFQKPGVLLALRLGNTLPSLDLVRIQLNGCNSPSTTVLYDLQSNVMPSPPGWILNKEFYSTTLDTCDQRYYLSTLHDVNSSSKLIEINIPGGTHVEQIFPQYLFGLEMKGLPCDTTSCCTDFGTFLNTAMNVQTFGELGDCMIHFNAIGLDSCTQISYLWGDAPAVYEGPYADSTAVWHTYQGPGIYTVCYLIEQLEPDGTICWQYEKCEDIEIVCDTCVCGSFTDTFISIGDANSQGVSCGGPVPTLACPQAGQSYYFTGNFMCNGNDCPVNAPVFWTLSGPNGTTSGSTVANPSFGINLLPTYFTGPGQYSLSLTGQCGSQMCSCIIEFIVDCPDLCPCDAENLMDKVDDGFATLLYTNSCKACFRPISLSGCVTVEWFIDNVNDPPIGSSIGNQTICHDFVNPGTYTIIMVVTQLKADGSICGIFTKSQTVSVSCNAAEGCDKSVFPNPNFDEQAIPGGLNSGGNALGWMSSGGDPLVEEGLTGSSDGWTILLSTTNDTSDILTTIDPICLEKGIGELSVGFGIKEKGIKSSISFQLFTGDNFELPDSNNWNPIRCLLLANIDLTPIDTGTWVNLQIPYDLADWEAIDTCGGPDYVWVRPVVYITSYPNTTARRTAVQLDYVCLSDVVTSLDQQAEGSDIQIFPNPTNGNFTIDLGERNSSITNVEVSDLWGRTVLSKNINRNDNQWSFSIAAEPAGIYLVKLRKDGAHIITKKIIKF